MSIVTCDFCDRHLDSDLEYVAFGTDLGTLCESCCVNDPPADPIAEEDDGDEHHFLYDSHDISDDADALGSAGWGTDEDYGC